MTLELERSALRRRSILIAERAEAAARLRAMLTPGGYELTVHTRMDESRIAAAQQDLIICGSHFDDSRMLEFLRYCMLDEKTRRTPFICVRVAGGALDNTLYQSVEIASKALGACAFVDLFRWIERQGEAAAAASFRELVAEELRRGCRFE